MNSHVRRKHRVRAKVDLALWGVRIVSDVDDRAGSVYRQFVQ